MAVDFEYYDVVGRIGLTVSDGPDADATSDTLRPRPGAEVHFTPSQRQVFLTVGAEHEKRSVGVHIAYVRPDGFLCESVTDDGAGNLTYGDPVIKLPRLKGERVNPAVPDEVGDWTTSFHHFTYVANEGTEYATTIRDPHTGSPILLTMGVTNDIGDPAVSTTEIGPGQPIVVGPRGFAAVPSLDGSDLIFTYRDEAGQPVGDPINVGTLPEADPAVIAAAAAEAAEISVPPIVSQEIIDRGLLQGQYQTDDGVLVSVRDGNGYRTWLEARTLDGAPTTFAAQAMQERLVEAGTVNDDPPALYAVRDANNRRTWLEVAAADGGPSSFARGLIGEGFGIEPLPTSYAHFAVGDSMTGDSYGGGTTYPAKLGLLLNKPVINAGAGGRRASEIAATAGAISLPVSVTGRLLPADTSAVACTVTWPDNGPNASRVFNVSLRGIPCTLTGTLSGSVVSYTIARKTAGSAVTLPKDVMVQTVNTYLSRKYVFIEWMGRNNDPKSSTFAVSKETGDLYRRERIRFLKVNICNSSAEGMATQGYADIVAVNNQIRAAFPAEYVDMRGRMIAEGLALAGLTATAEDTAAIADDRIPPQLLADGLHFNDAGRSACAQIIFQELTYRGLA